MTPKAANFAGILLAVSVFIIASGAVTVAMICVLK